MIESCKCEDQIIKVSSEKTFFVSQALQDFTPTDMEAIYRWITYTTNERALLFPSSSRISRVLPVSSNWWDVNLESDLSRHRQLQLLIWPHIQLKLPSVWRYMWNGQSVLKRWGTLKHHRYDHQDQYTVDIYIKWNRLPCCCWYMVVKPWASDLCLSSRLRNTYT